MNPELKIYARLRRERKAEIKRMKLDPDFQQYEWMFGECKIGYVNHNERSFHCTIGEPWRSYGGYPYVTARVTALGETINVMCNKVTQEPKYPRGIVI